MNTTLLMLAMLAQPEASVSKAQMHRIATSIIPEARKHSLDPTLLAAIAIAETGGRNLVAHGRGKNRAGADVGVFQIHCPHARPACIERYRDARQSAAEAAQILVLGRRLCVSPPKSYRKVCQRGFWARYNPGSVRWARRVRKLWGRIRDFLERHHSV